MTARSLLRASLLAACLAVSAPSMAHPIEEGTARVTLRDDHLEVAADWDLFLLVDGTPTAVATSTDEALATTYARLRREIEEGTSLRVDGASLPLSLTGFISAAELRAMAATLSAAGQLHGERVRMRLEARRAVPGARVVTLSAPAALGPVVVSFVQPSTRYAWPGRPASFDVMSAQRPPSHEPTVTASAPTVPPAAPRSNWLTALTALFGATAIVTTLRARRNEGKAA